MAYNTYFMRHWRGDLSLAVSFCVNYVLITLAFFLARWIPYAAYFDDKVRVAIALELAIYAVAALLLPWQVVGVWRSAVRRIKTANKRLGARVAQGLMALAVSLPLAIVAWLVLSEMPLLAGIAQVLFKPNQYEITLSDSGDAVAVSGYMEFGLTEEVERTFNRMPRVVAIGLESRGGRDSEGLRLGNLIKARRIATHVPRYCNSACTYAFIAGNLRIIDEGARLGFHKGNFRLNQEEQKRFFLSQGVDEAFVEKAFAVPYEEMWYPSLDELIQAGVITHIRRVEGKRARFEKVERLE